MTCNFIIQAQKMQLQHLLLGTILTLVMSRAARVWTMKSPLACALRLNFHRQIIQSNKLLETDSVKEEPQSYYLISNFEETITRYGAATVAASVYLKNIRNSREYMFIACEHAIEMPYF